MNKQKGYQVMAILMFIASGVITIMFMLSNVIGVIPVVVAFIQGAGIESAKSFFSYQFVITPSKQLGKKVMFGTLALVAFTISIIATTGFSINMSNAVKNEVMYNSDDYANKQNFIKTQGDLYEQSKKQLEDMKAQRDTQLNGLAKVRDQWGSLYKSEKVRAQGKYDAAADKANAEINTKAAELQKIADLLNQPTGEVQSEGYTALYNTLAKYINQQGQKVKDKQAMTGDDVSFWMNFCIAIALELFGIGFIYLSEQEKADGNTSVSKEQNNTTLKGIGFKPQIVTAQNNDVITGSSSGSRNNNFENRLVPGHSEIISEYVPDVLATKNPIGFKSSPSPSATASGRAAEKTEQVKTVETLMTPSF